MQHLPILALDVVGPLGGNRLIRPRQGVLRDTGHEGFEVQMMHRVANRLERRLEVGPDPFDVVFHSSLDN